MFLKKIILKKKTNYNLNISIFNPNVFNVFQNPYKLNILKEFSYSYKYNLNKQNNYKHIYSFSKTTNHVKKVQNNFYNYFFIFYKKKHTAMLFFSVKSFRKNELINFFFSTINIFIYLLNWNPNNKFFKKNCYFKNGVLLKNNWIFLQQNDLISTNYFLNNYILKKKKTIFLFKKIFFNFLLKYLLKKKQKKKQFKFKYNYILINNYITNLYYLDKRTNSILITNNFKKNNFNNNIMNFNFSSLYSWKILN